MVTVVDRVSKLEHDLYDDKGLKDQIKTNTTWITQATVKLNILFGVLTFLGITFGGLIITLIWEILTHKIVLGF